jgi:aryl-alcohol dehydrogenase-like predicted oxidoreductase
VNYRMLGRTGLEVSEVGYGAWGIAGDAWLGAKDEESLRALNRAVDLGLNFIDTALAYGEGHSERLVGKLVAERDETIYIATKVPPKNRVWPAPEGIPPEEVFPGDYVRECTEQSLSNLGLETIDVQQFHVWQDDWVGNGDWLEAVEDLKREGKIHAFGVSINDHQASNAVRLIEVPFDEGSLTGRITPDTTFEEGDFRNDYFRDGRKQEVYDRVLAIVSELGASEDEIAEIALRYILSHPAVSTVIPGMRSVRNVERNMAVGDGEGLPEEQVKVLKNHRWDRNFYA